MISKNSIIISSGSMVDEIIKDIYENGLKKFVFVYPLSDFKEGEENILDYIRHHRPKVIAIDGRLNSHVIENLYESIGNTVGTYDICTYICTIKQPIQIAGLAYAEIKNLTEKIESQ